VKVYAYAPFPKRIMKVNFEEMILPELKLPIFEKNHLSCLVEYFS
jgi:hypothetical protein